MTNLTDRIRAALLGRYDIEREIGHGGMATVFLARDPRHDRQVAVKVLEPELAASIGSERFLREVRITAQLNHPHILPLLDSGESDGLLYYVMPFVEGETLRARLDRQGAGTVRVRTLLQFAVFIAKRKTSRRAALDIKSNRIGQGDRIRPV